MNPDILLQSAPCWARPLLRCLAVGGLGSGGAALDADPVVGAGHGLKASQSTKNSNEVKPLANSSRGHSGRSVHSDILQVTITNRGGNTMLASMQWLIMWSAATMGAVVASTLATPPAKADWPYYFVQLTCVPELRFFSAQSLMIYNTFGDWNDRHLKELGQFGDEGRAEKKLELLRSDRALLQREYGYYVVESLREQPYVCDLGTNLRIEVMGDYTAPSGGMCKGIGSGWIQLKLNTRMLERVGVYGSCDHSTFRIEVNHWSVSFCRTTFGHSTWASNAESGQDVGMPTTCKGWSLN